MLIKIGTRRSRLATIQAEFVAHQIRKNFPNIVTEVVRIQTTGDIMYPKPLASIGGKGLFLKEIEEQLLDKKIDIAVHSMKDVPAELPLGLVIRSMVEREDPRDAFLSKDYGLISDLPSGARVGTCASRRKTLLLEQYPKLNIVNLRGNVETRIRKMEEGMVDGIVIAVSGLKRLNLENKINQIFSPQSFIPAVAQGAIGIECREDNLAVLPIIDSINHNDTSVCVEVEREFLKTIGGDCSTPMGAYVSMLDNDKVIIRTFLHTNGKNIFLTKHTSLKDAKDAAIEMAKKSLTHS